MAEQSGFFDAHLINGEYDRVYLSEHFAKYFASFIGNGVYGGKSDELMVRQKESADMSVRVLTGMGFINGYFYENTDELSLAIDTADGVLNRIDLIVLRWDKYERTIRIAVEKGSPASSPSTPLLKRNDDYYELQLAKVFVKAGATRISQADITDTRLDSDVCGFVVSVIEQMDTEEFNAQLNAWLAQFKVDSYAEVDALVEQLERLIASAGDFGPLIVDVENLKKITSESKVAPNNLNEATTIGFYSMPGETAVNYPDKMRFSYFGTLLVEHKENDIVHQTVRRENQIAARYSGDNGTTWGEWEYLNPMYEVDVEYRTLKRRNGSVVYERLSSDGVLRYRLEGSNVWNTYAAEDGAVKKTGDTMSNDLTIEKQVAPSLRLNAGNTGAGAILQMFGNQAVFMNRSVANTEDNYRFIYINNLNQQNGVEYALGFGDVRGGTTNHHTILHTGNLHLFGTGVLPASVEG